MNCPRCQTPIPDGSDVCPLCVPEQPIPGEAPAPRKSQMAWVAKMLAWLGLLTCGLAFIAFIFMGNGELVYAFLLGIAAFVPSLVLGTVAFIRIVRSKGRLAGRTDAVNAMVLSSFVLVLVCGVVWLFRDVDVRRRTFRTVEDIRSAMTAIEAYRTDNGTYPMTLWQLTTPVSYISVLPGEGERHNPEGSLGPLSYHPFNARTNNGATVFDGCVLLNPGPDKKADVDPARDLPPDQYLTHKEAVTRLLPKTYDVSNGTYSAGDILRISVGTGEKSSRKSGNAGAPTGTSDDSTTGSSRR